MELDAQLSLVAKRIKEIVVCPHYHFDLEWFKPEKEYAEDMIMVMERAREMLKENPDFTFVLDQAYSVIPYFREDPQAQGDFRRWIQEGRVEFVGGTLVAPDNNLPVPENLVRQLLYGKSWARRELGTNPVTGWGIDTFGHPPQLPQLLAKSGLGSYAFQRGVQPWDAWHPLDFIWEAPDGSDIIAHWFAGTYIAFTEIGDNPDEHLDMYFKEMLSRLDWEGRRTSANILLVPCGSDFLRPRDDWIDFFMAWNRLFQPPSQFVVPSRFFRRLDEERDKLPTVRGEFNPIFTGGYESRIELKQRSRMLGYALLQAERWSSIAGFLHGQRIPEEELDHAWELLLKGDFHDTINGTGTDQVTREALLRYTEAEDIIKRINEDALKSLGADGEQSGEGTFATVNSLTWERREPLSFPLSEEGEWHLVDDQGREFPVQVTGGNGYAVLTAPSLGWRKYRLLRGSLDLPSDLHIEGRSMRNQYLEVTFGEKGILELRDLKSGMSLLDTSQVEGGQIWVDEDVGNLWSNAVTDRDFSHKSRIDGASWRERGPVRATYEIWGRHKNLSFTTSYTLWRQFPRLDCRTTVNFKGKDRRIRVVFPLAVKGRARFTCETPFAATLREEGQWPAQNWGAVDWEGAGLALLNRGNPSYSWDGSILSITLLRSVSKFSLAWLRWLILNRRLVRKCVSQAIKAKKRGLNHFETNMYPVHWCLMKWWASPGLRRFHHGGWNFLDQLKAAAAFWQASTAWENGEHSFEYSLISTGGDWRKENLPRRGWELQTPMMILPWNGEGGERSYLFMEGKHLVVSALKGASEGKGLIIRLYDSLGQGGKVRLVSPLLKGIAGSALLTEDEDTFDGVPVEGFLDVDLGSWEVRTVRVIPLEGRGV